MSARQDKTNEQMDAEANYFAMCLLMPEEMVRAEVAKMGGVDLASPKKMEALARKFKVSEAIMGARIQQLMDEAKDA